jgi:hypothetical protein
MRDGADNMRKQVFCLMCLILFSGYTSLSLGQTRLMRQHQLEPSEQKILDRLISICAVNQQLYQPSLLLFSGPPSVVGLVSSIGGDGEHSYIYSWLFRVEKDTYVPIGNRLPYVVVDVRWSGMKLAFQAFYWVDFCDVCDGPDASEALVVIPIKGVISKNSTEVTYSGDDQKRLALIRQLEEKRNQTQSLPPESIARYRLAKRLLSKNE